MPGLANVIPVPSLTFLSILRKIRLQIFGPPHISDETFAVLATRHLACTHR